MSKRSIPATILLACAFVSTAAAQRVVRDTNTDTPLTVRWQTAVDEDRDSGQSSALALSFTRMMSDDYYFQRSRQWELHSSSGRWDDLQGLSLMQMTTGRIPKEEQMTTTEAVQRTARMVLVELGRLERIETLVPREVGLVVTYRNGAADDVWIGNVELNPRVESPVLRWLGHFETGPMLSLLESLYGDPNPRIREGVVAAVGAQSDADAAIPFLTRALRADESEDVRDEAASWLGRQYDARALPVLVAAVETDKSRDVQREAVEAIGELRVEAALDALLQIVAEHPEVRVRQEAVESIANFRTARAARALERIILNDKHRSIQNEAIEALGDMPPDLGTPLLSSLLATHPVSSIRAEVAEVLGERPSDESIVALKRAVMSDQSSSVRNEALEALSDMSGGVGIAAVIDVAMNHPSQDTKREAIGLLGESKDSRARVALTTLGGQ
jgi:HEAT repeat protein